MSACIRRLHQEDLPRVMAIEKAAYEFPWTENIMKDNWRSGYLNWAIEVDQQLIAYAWVSCKSDEAELLNITVTPELQARGYGRQLLTAILSELDQKGMSMLFLEVRESNAKAIKLYESLGFNQVGERRNYYPIVHGRENALIYVKQFL